MRRKLTLELDGLRVESFATVDADAGVRGTVEAAEDTLPTEMTCPTWKPGCSNTCPPTYNCPTNTCLTYPPRCEEA